MSHGRDYRHSRPDPAGLTERIRGWGRELGFSAVGFADTDLSDYETRLDEWLDEGLHGEMDWMAAHGRKRTRPALLHPDTRSVIVTRMDYLPESARPVEALLAEGDKAVVSRYALGRDYHKLIRKRLKKLAERIEAEIGPFGYRVFTDSAPVMEKPLAEKAGLGWIGKHTILLDRRAGSWFFLGEIFTDLELPPDEPIKQHCGSCRRCIDVCPTQAITAPFKLDARRCISYLTIELKGSIPEELRPLMGNRVFGCDDCQMVCPWNRYAQHTGEADFAPRKDLDAGDLVELFGWDEETFLERTEGNPIRRTGYECWLRNLAVALGNAPTSSRVVAALESRRGHSSELVCEHVAWALARHGVA
ncbi:tRNA epoxyqueuosine(34) reductase QueG [Wenzhouxiangella sp. XN201]|uniref:tRNA epoxyqueuosine(34) reductase QueG n=1 Tax=Wenzhouxiangella sp. XN201 TaxID=2710755 RepID=UPI0013CA7B34|nr:tRNA epoxyqueuosine(34) reductase QueG [Wenzhouxiangella sp. XN201]NEZ05056.1 tRNA epoxyqueuosine(34) reductase QueG [Wenzhouxiangella sp. XN201]